VFVYPRRSDGNVGILRFLQDSQVSVGREEKRFLLFLPFSTHVISVALLGASSFILGS
jgi:hypothetical protein